MTLVELLDRLRTLGIRVSLEGDQLRVSAARDTLTSELRDQLAAHKADIIARLRSVASSSSRSAPAIVRRADSAASPLSFAQARLWILNQVSPKASAFNLPLAIRMTGDLDRQVLGRCLDEIVRRHEALRTHVSADAGVACQVVSAPMRFELPVIRLDDLSDSDRERETSRLVTAAALEPFNLMQGPLFRGTLLQLGEQEHVLLLAMHHIISDGWSLGVLFRELGVLYKAYMHGEQSPLDELPVQYADVAIWQREWLRGETLERELEYWRQTLARLPNLQLPTDRARPKQQSYVGIAQSISLGPTLSGKLLELSRGEGVTPFMLMLTGFALLLHQYSAEEDFAIGSPVANRGRSELEPLIGFFVNMLVLRVDLSGAPTVREFLQRVKGVADKAYEHQDLPFEKLVEELQPARDTSRNPLFQVAMSFQNMPMESLELEGLTLSFVPAETCNSRFDLEVHVADVGAELAVNFTGNADLFEADTLVRLLTHYRRVLELMCDDPAQAVSGLSLLSGPEREQQVLEWNPAASAFPSEATIAELFEEQAARRPDAVAVAWRGGSLQYRELDERADSLARWLRARGVGTDVPVGVLLERSAQMVITWLAVLKAGGAYVPLDPEYPVQRLAFMLADTAAPVLVTDSQFASLVPDFDGSVLVLDREADAVDLEPVGAQSDAASALDLAYIIYTSGSTGEPKGVAVAHRSIVRLVRQTNYLQLGEDDVVVQGSSASFDAATFEVWGALLNGGRLELVERDVTLSARRYAAFLREREVTTLFVTTALFNQLVRGVTGCFAGIHTVLFGGEAVDVECVRQALATGGQRRLLHVYGPTESTTFASWYEVKEVSAHALTVPIGRPLSNTQLFVLDQNYLPVALGVPGELYIGGDGLARGYLGREELTAQRFVERSLDGLGLVRLYRTGDRVRRRQDGELEFLGRVDEQVKVRGFRIELGEVEAALRGHSGVQDAVVLSLDTPSGDKRLVGYVTAVNDHVAADDLRNHMREALPSYMVPASFVFLDELPMTPNGKIDRASLPAPEWERQISGGYQAPHSEVEKQIAAIWIDALQLERVGVEDNFFDLGGHSITLMQVHAQLEQALGRAVSVVQLFQYPTVASLARHLEGESSEQPLLGHAMARAAKRRAKSRDSDAIAVIAMSGRFPGASNLDEFWENLAGGVESIRFFSDEELREAGIPESTISHSDYVPARGVLDDAELFDASFFGYSPREAEIIDPQQRLFLECAHEALERAGYDPARFPGLIGVYGGCTMSSYLLSILTTPELGASYNPMQLLIGSDKDFVPTRVSYKLNLRGPSMTVQSACSTSLLAVHEACRSLLDHECDIALAGGSSVRWPRVSGYTYVEQSIMSPDGHCRAFDAEALGTVMGEGVGVVVLKRLDEALRDGDPIQAVVRGTAINNDGSAKIGFTAPSVNAQAEVVALALATADVDPDTVTYIEAHGTGTTLGDPIEIEALNLVYGDRGRDVGTCAIGSLKSNIGHLDAAAGVAGLIKTVLALRHKQLPPSLHFHTPNPKIAFDDGPFYVNAKLQDWRALPGTVRRAGVNAFGIGGTNAHAVLEEAPEQGPSGPSRTHQLLLLSAKSARSVQRAASSLAEHLSQHAHLPLADVSYTLRVGRGEYEHRLALTCRDTQEAIEALQASADQRAAVARAHTTRPPIVFMFPGQGTQHPGMGRALYDEEPVFKQVVDECCEKLQTNLGLDLRDLLYPDDEDAVYCAEQLTRTAITQPAVFVTEYALARLLIHWAVEPDACIGHSIGEIVAACIAGVIGLDDALWLVAERGRLMDAAPDGAMLAVPMTEVQLQGMLTPALSLAAVNAESSCVVAGTVQAVDEFAERLRTEGVESQRLHTTRAFHSHLMQETLEPLKQLASRLQTALPQIPYTSNVTGEWISADDVQDPAYWARHVREPVRFAQCLDSVLKRFDSCVLLEVGPGRTLGSFARQRIAKGHSAQVVGCLPNPREGTSAALTLAGCLAKLWQIGVRPDWAAYDADQRRARVELPGYSFDRKRYQVDFKAPAAVVPAVPAQRNADLADWFHLPTWQRSGAVLNAVTSSEQEPRRWLLFADASGLAQALRERLCLGGHQVCMVMPGERFSISDADDYVVRPGEVADYEALLAVLEARQQGVEEFVHLWGVTGSSTPGGDELVERCFYSPMFLAQALGRSRGGARGRLTLVSSDLHDIGGEESMCPEKATVMGPCRVIPQEYPELICRSVDLHLGSGDVAADQALQALLAELGGGATESVVAYRNGYRWLPSLVPTRLEGDGAGSARLREQGVYLITGGLGGVGLALASDLARSFAARLVLVGRRGLPPESEWDAWVDAHAEDEHTSRTIGTVREMRKQGAEVVVESADVADAPRMQVVIADALQRFGRIDGVIHAAGVAGGGVIQLKTRDLAAPVLRPKVTGTRVLGELLAGVPLDFMMLCSSITGLAGAAGQIDYTAANAFQDAYANCSRRTSSCYTVSINWDTWSDVGMALDAVLPQALENRRDLSLSRGLSSQQGQEAFRRVLSTSWPQVVVSPRAMGETNNTAAAADTAPAEPGATAATGRLLKHSDPGHWLYTPSWKRTSMPRIPVAGTGDARWLLLEDEHGVGGELARLLHAGGADVVRVRAGSGFARSGQGEYVVAAESPGDLAAVAADLQTRSWRPEVTVHLWGLSAANAGDEDSEALLARGFYGLLNCVQAFAGDATDVKMRLAVVTDQVLEVAGKDRPVAAKACVTGLCRVLPQELPGISCRHIDVEPGIAALAIDALFAELVAWPREVTVAHRGARRWVRTYEPALIDEPSQQDLPLREAGVYLITGGLGNIGLSLAGYLAKVCRARLVLTSRSPFPDRTSWDDTAAAWRADDKLVARIDALRAVEKAGAEVLIESVDVTDAAAMTALVKRTEAHFGSLNGVIHAAGVLSGAAVAPVLGLRRDGCEAMLAPKLQGAYALETALAGIELDFCMLTSSLSTVLGGLGHGAYAAANASLDAFAARHRAMPGGQPWTSVMWDSWRFPGAETASLTARLSMTPSEGIDVFRRVLSARSEGQIVVSTADLVTRLQHWVDAPKVEADPGAESETENDGTYERPDLGEEYLAPRNDTEERIARIWGQLLGIDKIGVHDNFLDLGGHSLLATQVLARIRGELHANLALEDMFMRPTVAELAMRVEEDLQRTDVSDDEEMLMQRIEDLSPEDRKNLLEKARRAKE